MNSAKERLEEFLSNRFESSQLNITQLTPDASLREYFRTNWTNGTAIACVYGEPFKAAEQTYLDVTNLFLVSGLPVAKIYDFDEELAVIVQEDFGDTILRDVLINSETEKREELLNEAITLIAKIQAATAKAFELNSIASRLKFDEEKLSWELNFFKEHYFTSFKKQPLGEADDKALTQEFTEISRELESYASVLTHRDFHAANLMIDAKNHLRIIDHQDARIGAASYDLVSLLLDRVLEIPPENWLTEKKKFFLAEREKLNLETIDFEKFDYEFQLQTIQRCLKATGTFSYQSTFRAKTYFVPYIKPMLQIVSQACARIEKFPNLQRVLQNELNP